MQDRANELPRIRLLKLSDNSGTAPIWTPMSAQNGPTSTISLPESTLSRTFGSPLAIYQTVSLERVMNL
jgi:hypothetical protein